MSRARLRAAAPNPLKPAFNVHTIKSFGDTIDPELREAVAALTPSELKEVTDLAVLAFRGESKQSFLKAMGKVLPNARYREVLAKGLDASVEAYGVPFFMSRDLKGFPDALLQQEFANYRPRGERNQNLNALEWAIETRARRAIAKLEELFGINYRTDLRAIKNRKGMLTRVTAAEARIFDEGVAAGILPYKELRDISKGLGHLYEADHLLEQRFWRNYPDLVTAFDFHGESFCYLVPKHARAATLLSEVPVLPPLLPREIRYVHSVKTEMLHKLIPHGREHEFSLQQIWDAHVVTFDALGLRREEYMDRFRGMFAELQRAHHGPLQFHDADTVVNFVSNPSGIDFLTGTGI